MDTVQKTAVGSQERILEFDLVSELHHGMLVSNLAYAVAEELGLPHGTERTGIFGLCIGEYPVPS